MMGMPEVSATNLPLKSLRDWRSDWKLLCCSLYSLAWSWKQGNIQRCMVVWVYTERAETATVSRGTSRVYNKIQMPKRFRAQEPCES